MNKKNCVWVFTANQAANGEVLEIIIEVFATEEAALKHMHDFVYGEEGEMEYAEKHGWTIGANDPDHFESYYKYDYAGNHTEADVLMKEVRQ